MSMTTVLWIAQIALAAKLLSATYTHGLRPDTAKMQRGFDRFDVATRPMLTVIGVLTTLSAVGLIVPAATGILPQLTAYTAAFVELMMVVSIALHTGCREKAKAWVSLLLCALAAFVAYGRWAIAPF